MAAIANQLFSRQLGRLTAPFIFTLVVYCAVSIEFVSRTLTIVRSSSNALPPASTVHAFQRFYDENLAQASYMIACEKTREAIVVDPNSDIAQYIRAAGAERSGSPT